MQYISDLFSKGKTPVSSVPPLTEKEVYDTVDNLRIHGVVNPSNQQIADILGRKIEDVTTFRPIGAKLHKYYEDDYKTGQEIPPPSRAISLESSKKMEITRENDPTRAKYFNALLLNNRLQLAGRRTNKNKKKYKKLSRRRIHKKNRKSMKRK